jgi:hypothetical protein
LSANYLNQFRANHGYGIDFSLNGSFANDYYPNGFEPSNALYEAGVIYTRKYLPSVGLRYRFFAGNTFFLGTSLQLGLIKERFFADRENYSSTTLQVDPIYVDYNINNPYFRLNFETGLLFSGESRLFATLEFKAGLQSIRSKVESYGTFRLDEKGPKTFAPLTGTSALVGGTFGLGIKL